MRKDQLWSPRAKKGALGYAALYPSVEHGGLSSLQPRPPAPLRPVARSGRARARAVAAARRRLVMTVLLCTLALATLIALVTGSTAAWWVVVGLLPLVCTYAAVVLRARRLMAEKEFNVAFLGGTNLATASLEDIFAARPVPGSIDLRDLRQVSAGMGR